MAAPLEESDLHPDAMKQFEVWFAAAQAAGQPEPEAMALATAGAAGLPSVRFVLLRGFDERGFVFYTNRRSQKARELTANSAAGVALRWWVVDRQVRATGSVVEVDDEESDRYFASRPRGAQLGAWASDQSEPLAGRDLLEERTRQVDRRFAGDAVTRPPWWGGYRLQPTEVEFWQGQPDRLHDRFRYAQAGGRWEIQRLNP